MSELQTKHLAIGFQSILFENINADLGKGKLTALMGTNGLGKSCLLKTIAGLIPKLGGDVTIDSLSMEKLNASELAKLIAVVLTEKIQVDYLTVEELVLIGRSPHTSWHGRVSEVDKTVVEEILIQLGIKNLKNNYFVNLSDGQKQKALIARALAQSPQVLILDEPTTYLDIPSKLELMKLLKTIAAEKNISILMSTHDLDLVEKFADDIWLMGNDGKFFSGSPAEIKSAGHIDRYFFKSVQV